MGENRVWGGLEAGVTSEGWQWKYFGSRVGGACVEDRSVLGIGGVDACLR